MVLILLALAQVCSAQPSATRIYLNGRVLTMDPSNRITEALAIRGERIVAAGTNTEIRKLAGAGAETVDLRGRVLLPGFYAAHDHLPSWGRTARFEVDLNSPPIGRMNSIEDYVLALRERAARTAEGQWIVARGYDDTLIAEKRHPTRADLDRASTKHPIWIIHTSGHLGAANSRALEIAKVGRSTPSPRGGVIRKDAAGEPSGVFEEALSIVGRHVPSLTRDQQLEAIRASNTEYLARGVTTAVVAGGNRERIADLNAALDRGWLQLRVVHMISGGAAPDKPAGAADWTPRAQFVRTGAIKLFQDGSIQGYTGFLGAPYHREPDGKQDYRGYAARPREELVNMVKRYHRAGYQIAIHANGDAAIDDVLRAYREAQRDFPRQDARHRIEHCQTPREDQLDAMKELAISPSFFNGHVYYWGDRHRDIFLGPFRGARISPLKSAVDRGIRFTIHNDTPVTPVNPLLLVWAAVNRETKAGQILGPDQRIGVMAALRAVTIDAAWQNFEENSKGSIEPGKLADFVILDRNPNDEPARIHQRKVESVIVGGVARYP